MHLKSGTMIFSGRGQRTVLIVPVTVIFGFVRRILITCQLGDELVWRTSLADHELSYIPCKRRAASTGYLTCRFLRLSQQTLAGMNSSAIQTAAEVRRWDCGLLSKSIRESLYGAATTRKRLSSVCLTLDRQVATCLSFAMTDVFEALAAPARRAILDVLCERDGQTLFEICARLTMKHDLTLTRQAISQHLDVLEAAGLLRTERDGRYKYHYLDTTPLNAIVKRWLTPKRKAGEE